MAIASAISPATVIIAATIIPILLKLRTFSETKMSNYCQNCLPYISSCSWYCCARNINFKKALTLTM